MRSMMKANGMRKQKKDLVQWSTLGRRGRYKFGSRTVSCQRCLDHPSYQSPSIVLLSTLQEQLERDDTLPPKSWGMAASQVKLHYDIHAGTMCSMLTGDPN